MVVASPISKLTGGNESGRGTDLRRNWRLAADRRKLNEGQLTDSGVSKPDGPFSTGFDHAETVVVLPTGVKRTVSS